MDPLGIKYVLTKDGPEQELMFENPAGLKDSGQEKYFEWWNPIGIKACKELKPDIIICDFMSQVGVHAAVEMGIPVVINCPGPIALLKDIIFIKTPDLKNARTCCGCICIQKTAMRTIFDLIVPFATREKRGTDYCFKFYERSILINSFWGLD